MSTRPRRYLRTLLIALLLCFALPVAETGCSMVPQLLPIISKILVISGQVQSAINTAEAVAAPIVALLPKKTQMTIASARSKLDTSLRGFLALAKASKELQQSQVTAAFKDLQASYEAWMQLLVQAGAAKAMPRAGPGQPGVHLINGTPVQDPDWSHPPQVAR